MKWLYWDIRLVFVFDGQVDERKKRIIQKRKDLKRNYLEMQQQSNDKLIKAKLRKIALEHVNGQKIEGHNHLPNTTSNNTLNDEFDLPEMSKTDTTMDWSHLESGQSENLVDEELSGLDIHSMEFRSLPMEIQQELLLELRIRSRRNTMKDVLEMKKEQKPLDFSYLQIKNVVKRNEIWQKLDKLQNSSLMETGEIIENRRIDAELDKEYILVKNSNHPMWTLNQKLNHVNNGKQSDIPNEPNLYPDRTKEEQIKEKIDYVNMDNIEKNEEIDEEDELFPVIQTENNEIVPGIQSENIEILQKNHISDLIEFEEIPQIPDHFHFFLLTWLRKIPIGIYSENRKEQELKNCNCHDNY